MKRREGEQKNTRRGEFEGVSCSVSHCSPRLPKLTSRKSRCLFSLFTVLKHDHKSVLQMRSSLCFISFAALLIKSVDDMTVDNGKAQSGIAPSPKTCCRSCAVVTWCHFLHFDHHSAVNHIFLHFFSPPHLFVARITSINYSSSLKRARRLPGK